MLRVYTFLIFALLMVADLKAACPKLCYFCECVEGDRVHSRNNIPFEMFIGIPYAEPPVGVLRFKNPVPLARRNLKLVGEQSECLQRDIFYWQLKTRGDEDCLYLNIYRPDVLPNERLPVLVYFPHSNLVYGSGHVREVAPDTLMEKERIVLVVAQFRVGLFGFFTTGDRHAPGNLGLKDQQLALYWVYNSISFFSGDPHDVTVYGDASVQYQILPREILFRRAIISGSYMFSYYHGAGAMTAADAGKMAGTVSKHLYEQELIGEILVKKLQEEHALAIMAVHNALEYGEFYPFQYFGPVIETDVVVWYNNTPTPRITSDSTEQERQTALELLSARYPNFLVGEPTKLWRTHEHDITIMLGYSNYYGEQLVQTMENFTKFTEPLSTFQTMMLHLNITTHYRASWVLRHYFIEEQKVFSITHNDRKQWVKLFNDYFYFLPLVKSIVGYNENTYTAQKLYIYSMNESTSYNNADAQHLFPLSYEVVYESSVVVIAMFEEFINTGLGPLEACIISNEHPSGALCPYPVISLNQNGVEEKVDKDVFEEANVDFWNSISPLKA